MLIHVRHKLLAFQVVGVIFGLLEMVAYYQNKFGLDSWCQLRNLPQLNCQLLSKTFLWQWLNFPFPVLLFIPSVVVIILTRNNDLFIRAQGLIKLIISLSLLISLTLLGLSIIENGPVFSWFFLIYIFFQFRSFFQVQLFKNGFEFSLHLLVVLLVSAALCWAINQHIARQIAKMPPVAEERTR